MQRADLSYRRLQGVKFGVLPNKRGSGSTLAVEKVNRVAGRCVVHSCHSGLMRELLMGSIDYSIYLDALHLLAKLHREFLEHKACR